MITILICDEIAVTRENIINRLENFFNFIGLEEQTIEEIFIPKQKIK